jgi:hypothetical protein
MTRLEKAHELRPELRDYDFVFGYCPEEILAMDEPDCKASRFDCYKCWNAEWQEEQEG